MGRLKVAAIIEANTVTGPAKNLLRFGRQARDEVELEIITYTRGDGRANLEFRDAVARSGLNCHLVRESGAYDPGVIQQLRTLTEEIRPDVVQTHSVKSHFLWRASGGPARYPWVAFHHGYTAENLKVKVYNQLDRWSLGGARRIITVCEAFRDELTAKGIVREKVTVIHNGVEAFVPGGHVLEAEAQGPPGSVTVLHVGRFSGEKNHEGLIQAAGILATTGKRDQFQLVLVGEGVSRSRIEALARSGEAGGARIHFAGQQSDVGRFYDNADIFVLPSHSEGSPNVVLEAMAAGLPVVATRVGGTPDMVLEGETGYLVARGDVPALAQRLGELISNGALRKRMGEAGRERVREFSVDKQRQTLLGVYRSLL